MKQSLVYTPIDYATSRLRYLTSDETRVMQRRLLLVLLAGAVTWPLAGLGFYYLEPTVGGWFEGARLAFVSGATVGYGDFVPTTLASRLFAIPLVLDGLAYLSLMTATISALFVGETERKIDQMLMAEIKVLRKEVHALREELQDRRVAPESPPSAAAASPASATGTPAAG